MLCHHGSCDLRLTQCTNTRGQSRVCESTPNGGFHPHLVSIVWCQANFNIHRRHKLRSDARATARGTTCRATCTNAGHRDHRQRHQPGTGIRTGTHDRMMATTVASSSLLLTLPMRHSMNHFTDVCMVPVSSWIPYCSLLVPRLLMLPACVPILLHLLLSSAFGRHAGSCKRCRSRAVCSVSNRVPASGRPTHSPVQLPICPQARRHIHCAHRGHRSKAANGRRHCGVTSRP